MDVRQHVLQRLSGPINAIPADINGDKLPDIVTLVSQEWEEIWAFINDGGERSRRGCSGARPMRISDRAG